MEPATVSDDRAARLAELWSRLSLQHVTLGAGCGCGAGGVSVSLADFERDIADYLQFEAERLGETRVSEFLALAGPLEAQPAPVRDLLERLARDDRCEAAAQWLLPRLTRTIESFARLHGPTASI